MEENNLKEVFNPILDDEKLKITFENGTVYYQRITYDKEVEFTTMATKKGKIDYYFLTKLVAKHCIIDWDMKLEDEGGNYTIDYPFSKEKIDKIPQELLAKFSKLFRKNIPEWEDELKN